MEEALGAPPATVTAYAGVDGGGSRTRALIVGEDGRAIGRAEGPPGIFREEDPEAAVRAVVESVEAAARGSGVSLPLKHLCCGLAGAGSAAGRGWLQETLRERSLAHGVTVTTDVEVAFRDAFEGGEAGILLVSGTGSVAVGRGADGGVIRAGGWGALLDDAGSAYWLGLRAIRAVLRSGDGRAPPTDLTEAVLGAMGVSDPPLLAAAAGRASKGEVGSLAPLVVESAEAGDPVAASIVDEGLGELVRLVEAVSARLTASAQGGRVPVALHGGVVAPGAPLHRKTGALLEGRGFPVLRREVSGTRGAARMALEALEA